MNTTETSAVRSIKIHLVMYKELMQSVKRFITFVGKTPSMFTEKIEEADVVIFTEKRDIASQYNEEQFYIHLVVPGEDEPTSVPKNCVVVNAMQIVGLTEAIAEIYKNFTPAVEPVLKSMPLRTDALRILVIDDTPTNIRSAKVGLAGHLLRTATGYDEAMKILGNQDFDVVLTDLEMPMSPNLLAPGRFKLGELVPYGFLIAIEAARQGAKFVAIATDGGHHAGPLQAAFDHFSKFPVKIEGAKVVMVHACTGNEGKSWSSVLADLMEG